MTDMAGTEYDDEGNAEMYVVGGTPGYDMVIGQVTSSLTMVRDRLHILREQKERIRAEIKQLVSQERILERMERIALRNAADGE